MEDCFGYEQVKLKELSKINYDQLLCVKSINLFKLKVMKDTIERKPPLLKPVYLLQEYIYLIKKILNELSYLSISVDKTAGTLEKKSWKKILKYIDKKIDEK